MSTGGGGGGGGGLIVLDDFVNRKGEAAMETRMFGLFKELRDAFETAAGQYGPVTDEQRNEWLALVKRYDEWDAAETGAADPEGSEGDADG